MSRIRKGRFRRRRGGAEDDVNPMEGAVNIVDARLVFACGLMLSLVIYWNVDLNSNDLKPVTQGASISESELDDKLKGEAPGNDSLKEVGRVYRDPVTGNLYLDEGTGSK
jgi:hypothetical protein